MVTSKSEKFKESNTSWKKSGISRIYPSYRNHLIITHQSWLCGKQNDDEAEGLWRINDTLYDFTNFIRHHPGGSFWLEKTKGTDITEAFESHHITTLPESILSKYEVRKASKPRNYLFTMDENGFYKTLKRRIRDALPNLEQNPRKQTDVMHLGLLIATFGFTILSAKTRLPVYEILASLSLCWLTNAAHNYFHRKDNWQMYTFNFSLLNFCEWRISHALSHHIYPNSLHDLEMVLLEPFLCWIPKKYYSTKIQRAISIIIQPFVYMAIFPVQFSTRLIKALTNSNAMYWHDIIGFTLPFSMVMISSEPFLVVLRQWIFILLMSSFLFGFIGLNAGHHHPKNYHDYDTIRNGLDWGLFQLDTLIDRSDIKGSQFMILTNFGAHSIHHLFPTLDHGILPQLYPIVERTLLEFQVQLREGNQLELIVGQNKQLLRTEPNPLPPGM